MTRADRLIPVALLGAIGTLAACSSSPRTAADTTTTPAPAAGESEVASLSLMDEAPITSDHATLRVEGLSCPACATNVDHQLKDVPGVRLVEVNLGDGTVALSLGGPSRPSRADLARAIHDSGFTLRAIDVP